MLYLIIFSANYAIRLLRMNIKKYIKIYIEKFIGHQFIVFNVKKLKKKYKDNLNLIK